RPRSRPRSRRSLCRIHCAHRTSPDLAKVVVIDDSPADRYLAETLLKHAGHTVLLSADGKDGLNLIWKEAPDLIIADLITPGIDGYDLARAVRSDPQTAGTPIILQTAHYLEEEVRRLGRQIGIQEVIIKPYEPQAFLDVVAKAFRDTWKSDRGLDASTRIEFQLDPLRLVSAKLHEKVREVEEMRQELDTTATKYQLLFKAHPEAMLVVD